MSLDTVLCMATIYPSSLISLGGSGKHVRELFDVRCPSSGILCMMTIYTWIATTVKRSDFQARKLFNGMPAPVVFSKQWRVQSRYMHRLFVNWKEAGNMEGSGKHGRKLSSSQPALTRYFM